MSVAEKYKIEVTKDIEEAFAKIAEAEALKSAKRAHPYPKQDKDGVVLNWITRTTGCRPSRDYIRCIKNTKSQAKPKPVKKTMKPNLLLSLK